MLIAEDVRARLKSKEFDALVSSFGDPETALAPDLEDLLELYLLARTRGAQTVVEFGVGYSTWVLAAAVAQNAKETDGRASDYRIHVVDGDRFWLDRALARIPAKLRAHVEGLHSPVETKLVGHTLCHHYIRLPNVVPDFLYLDGPDLGSIQNHARGLDFAEAERTPMAVDPLLYESTALPGAFLVVDGRENNVRFLARRFERFQRLPSRRDQSYFELLEPPLGPRDDARLRARLGNGYFARLAEQDADTRSGRALARPR